MRYGIFSDIHSNLEALEAVIKAYEKERVDRYLCLGDMVGYAANPKECIRATQGLTNVIVAGNHDWAVADLLDIEYFNPVAKEAILLTKNMLTDVECKFLSSLKLVHDSAEFTPLEKAADKVGGSKIPCKDSSGLMPVSAHTFSPVRKVFSNGTKEWSSLTGFTLVHSSLDNPEKFRYVSDEHATLNTFDLMPYNLCFVGHTHIPAIFIKDKGSIKHSGSLNLDITINKKYIINVGSVGQPRDTDNRASYCIYDADLSSVEIKRASYNIRASQAKIISRGLPLFFATRLSQGV